METTDTRVLLGPIPIDQARIAALLRRSAGDDRAAVDDWWVEVVDYLPKTPSTGALLRVKATVRGNGAGSLSETSIFVKLLQSPRHWEHFDVIPAHLQEAFVRDFPWRLDAMVHQSGIAKLLPDGLRIPVVYDVQDLGDDRIALWLEDVQVRDQPWDVDRFARAAHLLGRLAARRLPDRVGPLSGPAMSDAGGALRYYVEGKVLLGDIPSLRNIEVWSHPLLEGAVADTGDVRLRQDLLDLADRAHPLLDALEGLPQTYAHGDACPQNLLVSATDPDTFVIVDWGFDSPLAVGFDLGQLLVGLVHSGELGVDALDRVDAAIVPAYLAGLRAEGMEVDEQVVRFGYVGSLVLRSAFSALPFELLGAEPTPGLRTLFVERMRLTRFLVDRGLSLALA